MTTCYKIMSHLPAVPDELVTVALQRATDFSAQPEQERVKKEINRQDDYLRGRVVVRGDKKITSRPAPRADISSEFSQWVDLNISREWSQIGVGLNLPPDNGQSSDLLAPHTDKSRAYSLMYLLDQSNHDQFTVWYQEVGQPVCRKRNTMGFDFDQLIELDRICMPSKTWVYLNTDILHSVENVQGFRTSIQISFDIDPFETFVK